MSRYPLQVHYSINTIIVCFFKVRDESKLLSVLTDVTPQMLSTETLEDIQDSIKNTSPSAGKTQHRRPHKVARYILVFKRCSG